MIKAHDSDHEMIMLSEKQLLKTPDNMWDFEHIVSGVPHYAVWRDAVTQHQIVSKGKWARGAERLLNKQGLSMKGSARPVQSWREWLRGVRRNISFQLFGFTSFRIKRWLRRMR